ncbi:glycoside hydrolase family 3 protein [Aliterella atlantica]|uniref:beta-N-acetylhexosaminidase n=1 Tax=Aliterella atlantica CENA595 TaxID=1618023 RepID=A0A0D8ZWP4_9CYAN|nr:glycoside hydrolase family 3 N-terminal domain-containing protein [Aliterella atlantica]KJH72864.1 beta-glucosidase [Aliterella atlantica CENA595]
MTTLPDLDTLTLAELVAQMVVVRASGYLFDRQIQYPVWEPTAAKLQHLIELGVGGVIFLGGSAVELTLRAQQVQNWAKIPLLISADIEEGVGQRFSGATWFAPPMAISSIARQNPSLAQQYAQQMGAITAQEALAIGINWILAPTVDVNNNPNNPVINIRAFGENPAEVSQLTTAFIQGAKNYPALTTAKHFPGHGDTSIDSHFDLPIIPHSPQRLAEIELPPFQAAIASGVDAVMSAHLIIKCWDAENPATLSAEILTHQLRQNLGFTGLIVTDALVMGAIANRYGANEAPVLAVEAGADILLMPLDPEGAIKAVCSAVESGRISPYRIRDSVERIWHAKAKVSHTVAPDTIATQLAQSAASDTVMSILQASGQVYGKVPLQLSSPTEELLNVVVVDQLLTCNKFLNPQAPAIAIPQQLGYTTWLCDRHTPLNNDLAIDRPTLLQLFIRSNPFQDSTGLTDVAISWFKKLLSSNNLQALVIYGSPYVLEKFMPAANSSTPCVFSYGQMPDAQAIALQSLFGV